MPPIIEKEIALIVKQVREQFFSVFIYVVIKWAAEAIAGTDHASYFPDILVTLVTIDGKRTRGWHRGWLFRNELITWASIPP